MKMKDFNVRKKHEQKLQIKASPPSRQFLELNLIKNKTSKINLVKNGFATFQEGDLESRETILLAMKMKIVKE